MSLIVVASKNPVKIACTQDGFTQLFPAIDWQVQGINVPSGVPDQPRSRTETLTGARNRVLQALQVVPDADYWVGIEGGVEMIDGSLAAFAWIVIQNRDGQKGQAQSGLFFLPDEVARLVQSGLELGDADDQVFGRTQSKQGNGAVGLLTGDVMDRRSFYVQAVILALIPFKNPHFVWS